MKHILKKFKLKSILPLLVAILFFSCSSISSSEIYIRTNQVGFKINDLKTAIILSNKNLLRQSFSIMNFKNNKKVFSNKINEEIKPWGKFKYAYKIDFSPVKNEGEYFIKVKNNNSFSFKIGNKIYDGIVDSLLLFLRVQRCGPTNPYLHVVCHLWDSPRVIGDNTVTSVDVTGGWHDAADYIKFFSTIAYTTYTLLFTYEFYKDKSEFDNNKNGAPDILEEAKVGIDWLIRANYNGKKFITQVQDLRDHENSWRLPENDSLKYDRPAFVGIGKNQIGIFTAVMSLTSKIWKEKFYDDQFSEKCLDMAKNMYAMRNSVPDIDSTHFGFYQDKNFYGKLALGAIELYNVTKDISYLNDSKIYADSAKSDYWWSWGDINSFAHYKIAKYEPRFKNYLLNNLIAFNTYKDSSSFGNGAIENWGTTNTILGIALQTILWKKLTKGKEFDSLFYFQRDYILGKNPWGISFVYNIGKIFPKRFHSQIAYFNKGYLPGAVAAGPSSKSILDNYDIKRENSSYNKFNSDSIYYYDDWADYITNEPTISTNATAIFVFYYLKSK